MTGLMPMKKILITLFVFASMITNVQAKSVKSCFKEASNKHNVPLPILLAVAYTESRFKTKARNGNTNGTRDYGIMQINSIWSKEAYKMGYSWKKIKHRPCTNIMFGSRILRDNRKRLGNWKSAIGAYNAGFGNTAKAKKRRNHYYRLVMKHKSVASKRFKKIKARG